MGKFNKTGGRSMPKLNTSSLPDLIFSLLFFFMMVTTMREVTLKVQFKAPQGTELEKLEKKSLVTFIYVGVPTQEFQKQLGSESRIQLNDSFAEVSEIQEAAAKMIIGNWELIKSTETDSLNIYANLQFDADGKAEYEGTSNNDYRVLYYKLLPGWSENDGELSGYISFIIWGDPSENNRHERFYCVFRADGEMRLIRNNHPGEISTVPPEVYRFKRVSIEK